MKKSLLSLFSVALLASAAFAQAPLTKNPLAPKSFTSKSFRMAKQTSDVKSAGMMVNPTQKVRTLDTGISKRNPKELSYQITGDEMANSDLISSYLTADILTQNGITGWGYAIAFPAIIVDRYVGNTINKINVLPYLGRYSDSKVFIGQMADADGNIRKLWEKDVTIKGGQLNTFDCDYVIPDTLTQELIIGWFAGDAKYATNDTLAAKYGIVAPAFLDQTGSGMSGLMLGTAGDGNAFLINMLGYRDNIAVSNTITAETTGNGGLGYNDATVYRLDDARGFCNKTSKVGVTLVNMGLDSLRSISYTVKEADGAEKQYTYNAPEPVGYMQTTVLDAPVKMAATEGRTVRDFDLTHVNGQPDAYTKEEENIGRFQSIAYNQAYHRTPVYEHFTSVSSVAGAYTLAGMQAICDTLGEDNVVNIAVHGDDDATIMNDPYTASTYADYFSQFSSSLPYSMVNRELDTHPYAGGLAAGRYIQNQSCEATAKVSGTNGLRGTTINATFKFSIDIPDSTYAVAYVVTEDGLETNQYNGFAQNYMMYPEETEKNFGGSPYLWPLCTAESTVLNNKYVVSKLKMNNVARYMLDAGADGTILRAAKAGQEVNMTTTIRSSLINATDSKNLRVAALLVDGYTGKVVTAAQAKIGTENSSDDNLYTGINNATAVDFAQICAANGAFHVKAANASAQVYDAQGRLVANTLVDGTTTIAVGGKGVYVIRVSNGAQTVTKKAIF